jgi:hypothetical protein
MVKRDYSRRRVTGAPAPRLTLGLGNSLPSGASDECAMSYAAVPIHEGKYVKENTLRGIKIVPEMTKLTGYRCEEETVGPKVRIIRCRLSSNALKPVPHPPPPPLRNWWCVLLRQLGYASSPSGRAEAGSDRLPEFHPICLSASLVFRGSSIPRIPATNTCTSTASTAGRAIPPFTACLTIVRRRR